MREVMTVSTVIFNENLILFKNNYIKYDNNFNQIYNYPQHISEYRHIKIHIPDEKYQF